MCVHQRKNLRYPASHADSLSFQLRPCSLLLAAEAFEKVCELFSVICPLPLVSHKNFPLTQSLIFPADLLTKCFCCCLSGQDLLDRMEDEVCDFFEAGSASVRVDGSPSVYQSCLPSWYQRMLLHATSQYLNLVCKSKSLVLLPCLPFLPNRCSKSTTRGCSRSRAST